MEEHAWTPALYDELRAVAERCFRGQPAGHTLQPTVLVSEAWLKLAGSDGWADRTHFLSVAARAMRQVLVDHARGRAAAKRGGGWTRVTLSGRADQRAPSPVDVLALDEALQRLAATDERQAHIIELRFFGGLGAAEIATLTDVSRRTVELDLQMARAWIARELSEDAPRHA